MNHQIRRGPPPVECPLASLGRNTPALDTQSYHHPLSSSPLNPQVYQMSRKSPNLSIDETDDIIYNSTASTRHKINENDRHNETSEIYHLSRSSSSSIDQSSYEIHQDSENINNNTVINNSKTTQQINSYISPTTSGITPIRQLSTTRNYIPIDSLLKYQEHSTNSPSYLFENIQNSNDDKSNNGRERNYDTTDIMIVNHHDQYFLEKKMDSLYIQGAVRGLPLGSEANHYKNDQYYLEENLNNICNFNGASDRLHGKFRIIFVIKFFIETKNIILFL